MFMVGLSEVAEVRSEKFRQLILYHDELYNTIIVHTIPCGDR